MPYTVTHVLIAIILIELFREYFVKDNKKFPRYYILIAAIAGVFPDFEYLFQLSNLHATFLHSLFTPLIFLIAGLLVFKLNINQKGIRKMHMEFYAILFIFSAGSLLHILLDILLKDGVILFYPFSESILSFNLLSLIPLDRILVLVGIDTVLLFFWIFWMEFKLKIRDYF